MSIQVNDFLWEPGKNDAEYIKLLESSRDEWQKIAQKAIAKLKTLSRAQEPRVMTWQDVIGAAIECKPLYIEVKDSEDKEPGDDRWAMVTQYKDSITNGMILAMSSYVTSEILFAEDYDKRFRCWTSRPDEKRMTETPWDAQSQREYEAAVEMAEYCERYEPTYNADDGSM